MELTTSGQQSTRCWPTSEVHKTRKLAKHDVLDGSYLQFAQQGRSGTARARCLMPPTICSAGGTQCMQVQLHTVWGAAGRTLDKQLHTAAQLCHEVGLPLLLVRTAICDCSSYISTGFNTMSHRLHTNNVPKMFFSSNVLVFETDGSPNGLVYWFWKREFLCRSRQHRIHM